MAQDNLDNIEKLLEIAENSKEEIVLKPSVVDKFIRENNIRSGEDFIPNYIIYYTYYRWKSRNRINKIKFFRLFKKHFTTTVKKNTRGYLLNSESFNLTQEGIFRAKVFERRENVKKEKNKKKSD